ncbi:family 78 glycoside hydrolase catalytic domain [Dysgonomonas sp. HDW5B]|uniref:glycoside hydrolase family 78 protein n=1 Tax=Dysgonomonas sp. HDW5B TaxID=2714927 RepID=UPI0014078586|nr:glycoside hydrolase family 78 protein [Dysgonomonas sp. HDW5B]QIK53049.1 family 78 glycoside hydrolase catalytic domain [Dysgonomonas sp. HDW5B]
MKNIFIYLIIFSNCITSCTKKINPPTNLQCEHLDNPLGIDSPSPRLTWRIAQTEKAQTAYQIMVSTDSIKLANNKADMWDTGKIDADSCLVTYKGDSLKPFTKYYWKVTVWNEKDTQSKPSDITSFETGLISSSNWAGKWISDGQDVSYKPTFYFRKDVNLDKNKKIKSARAYITAAGLYELSINGLKVGDRMLDPMYTRFDKRNLYSTLDITSLLQNGANTFGVILGNGWYNHQSTAVWDFDKAHWRGRPKFLINIRLNYEDGTSETIVSDESWKIHESPILFNSIYTAEHYDARKEIEGWNMPGLDTSEWLPAVIAQAPSPLIVSQQLYPIRITERLEPTKIDKKNDTCYVFSFAKNIAGIIEIRVQGDKDTELRIKHSERLYPDGRADMSNIDVHYRPTDNSDPFQTDIFILKGGGIKETFSPKFNYKGFQYVEVTSSKPIDLSKESITALELHSDVPQIGSIKSSNPTLDKIWEVANNSYLSNLFGYPTDCPQREKNGWTGDSHIAIETGLYSYDAITIYEKWMNDFKDEQKPNGVLPSIVPTHGWGYDWGNGPDWTSAVAIIPWEVYLFYGDIHLLHSMYGNIKRYVDHIASISPHGTTDWGLGDWVPVKTVSNKELTSSLYYYKDVTILAHAAKMFGRKHDYEHYTRLAKKISNAINKKFLNTETGIYCSGSQTELAAPLYWGVVPEELKSKVAENLYKKVEEDNFHIDTGILGAKALLHALSENGYADAAYTIAAQETYPSWGWWIVNGATTLYENWNIDAENDISMNHIMFGDINAWMYKALGGLFPDENKAGFKHIQLRPNFVKGLDQFEAKHTSPYGEIVSSWTRRTDKQIIYHVVIPANTSATLHLPKNIEGDKTMDLSAGTYNLELREVKR